MKFKNIIPYEKFELVTALPMEEIARRLTENVRVYNNHSIAVANPNKPKLYEGEVTLQGFTISRIISYRNSFLPEINGQVFREFGHTKINISMKLLFPVKTFLAVWLGVMGALSIFNLCVDLYEFETLLKNGISQGDIHIFLLFIFGCLIAVLPFKAESSKSKQFLVELFEGTETV